MVERTVAARRRVLLAANGSGASATWANPVVTRMLPALIDALRGDLATYCPNARIDGSCPWARTQLTQEMLTVVDGPLFSGSVDLLQAIRSNVPARVELEQLVQYLLGPGTPAAQQATLTALHDILQLFSDDTNLTPVWNALATGTARRSSTTAARSSNAPRRTRSWRR